MDATYLLEWANLLLRWAHVIVAIAWIGSSFYFVFLDASLLRPADPALRDKGVAGELWAVHGGGFYNPQKYLTAPKTLPPHLHWFYWESYSTWLTGFALFTVLYLVNAGSFLVDRRLVDWSSQAAGAAALALLGAFWLVYDGLCRIVGERGDASTGDGGSGRNREPLLALLVLGCVAVAAWAACRLFPGRAAFVLVGAMLATAMSANVLVWIIPGQRKVVAQLRAGQPVDPVHGRRAKQRSVHNTYFTLPVLVAMLSNHYGWLTDGRWNAPVLVVLMLAGALIRHSFVARHAALARGARVPWEYAAAGCALLLGLVVALAPPSRPGAAAAAALPPPRFAEVRTVVEQRCVICHNAQVNQKNVMLHSAELVAQHAAAIYLQAVVLKAMPFANATGISDEERALIGRWYAAGAPTR